VSEHRLRILVLNQYFHPDRSATSQLLTELCEDLALVHDVTVVTGRPSYDPQFPVRSKGLVSDERHRRVKVARVWSTQFDRTSGMVGRAVNYATYLASSVVGAVRAGRPDVVLALTDPPPIGLTGLGIARLRGVPFVLVSKDVFPEVAVVLRLLSSRPVIGAARRVSQALFRGADRVVSIGRDMDERLVARGVPRDRISTIHDWSDASVVHPLDGPSVLRSERGWDDRFVVMHSGNVGLSQSLDALLGAADLLRDDPDVVVAVVGEGAAKAGLQAEARRRRLSNVEFLPYQPYETLSDSLGAANVHVVGLRRGLAGFVVPSKVFGVMAAGRPFIAAVEPEAEPALIAVEHGCGIRVEPDDPEALAEGIRAMRETDLGEMSRNARKAFEERFDRPRATEAYRRLLESVGGSVALGGQRT
jgi:putative colanic acid biosynthesis glycosyltransferase WcaI